MSSPMAAIAEIEKYVRVFKAFEEAKASLEVLANIELTTKEYTQVKEDLIVQVEELKKEYEQASKDVKEIKAKGKVELSKVEEVTKKTAKDILEDARSKGDSILADANAKAVEAEIAVVSLEDKSKTLSFEIKEKMKQLTELEDKIVSAKISINKILGV